MKLIALLFFVVVAAVGVGCSNGSLNYTGYSNCTNCGGNGGSAINFVQATPKAESTSAIALTMSFASPPAVGNLIVFYFCQELANVTSVVDSYANSYTQAWFENNASWYSYVYYAVVNTTGPTFNVTVSMTTSGILVGAAAEFSGLVISSPLDQTARATANLSSTASSGITSMTIQPKELLVANLNDTNGTGSINYNAAWTPVFTETNGATYVPCQGLYQIVNVQSTYSHTWTTSSSVSSAAGIATFKGL